MSLYRKREASLVPLSFHLQSSLHWNTVLECTRLKSHDIFICVFQLKNKYGDAFIRGNNGKTTISIVVLTNHLRFEQNWWLMCR